MTDQQTASTPQPGFFRGPWMWYTHLCLAISVFPQAPLLIVATTIWRDGYRSQAVKLGIASTAGILFQVWLCFFSPLEWWQIIGSHFVLGALWGVASLAAERAFLGKPERRYWPDRWKSWVIPIVLGILLGMGNAIFQGPAAALEKRKAQLSERDILDREGILLSFFDQIPQGAAVGLLFGIIIAGLPPRRRLSTPVAAQLVYTVHAVPLGLLLIGLAVTLYGMDTPSKLFTIQAGTDFIPAFGQGSYRWLAWSAKTLVPLLLGAALMDLCTPIGRIRDAIWIGAILGIFQLFSLVCTFSPQMQGLYFGRAEYDLCSPDAGRRSLARWFLKQTLTQFPEMKDHGWKLLELALHAHADGDSARRQWALERIHTRYAANPAWGRLTERAASMRDAKPAGREVRLDIPMVDFEDYLSRNWMTVLAAIRYWDGPSVNETDLKARLKPLSLEDDRIRLRPMRTFADLDDAMAQLGYSMVTAPMSQELAHALLDNGVPFIPMLNWRESHQSWWLYHGYDPGIDGFLYHDFGRIPDRLRKEGRKDADAIVDLAGEEGEKSRERLDRIRIASTSYRLQADIGDEQARFRSPYLAIIFPEAKAEVVARAFKRPFDEIRRESNGMIAAWVAESFRFAAQPDEAMDWAKVATTRTADPLAAFQLSMARRQWEARKLQAASDLNLAVSLPQLNEIARLLAMPENVAALDQADAKVEAWIDEERLPRFMLWELTRVISRRNASQAPRELKLLEQIQRRDPFDPDIGEELPKAALWAGDLNRELIALRSRFDNRIEDGGNEVLDYMLALVKRGKVEQAGPLLDHVNADTFKFRGDYWFCKAVVLASRGKDEKARKAFERAIDLHKQTPLYHLEYGRLLKKLGQEAAAEFPLRWAAEIDLEGDVRERALALLSGAKP